MSCPADCVTPAICAAPTRTMFSFDAKTAVIGQTPGRRQIALDVTPDSSDEILILVDDAPGLSKDQMRVSVELDPLGPSGSPGVTWDKELQGRAVCHGQVNAVSKAMMIGGNILPPCQALTPANHFTSGCATTNTTLIERSSTHELWLAKPGFFNFWVDATAFDASIWRAFAGRSLRFIWRRD